VLREKRYLRGWETSFSAQALKEGERVIKKVLKEARCKAGREWETVRRVASRREKLSEQIARKVKALTKKQVSLIIVHYDLFKEVLCGGRKREGVQASTCMDDRYYIPKKHNYR